MGWLFGAPWIKGNSHQSGCEAESSASHAAGQTQAVAPPPARATVGWGEKLMRLRARIGDGRWLAVFVGVVLAIVILVPLTTLPQRLRVCGDAYDYVKFSLRMQESHEWLIPPGNRSIGMPLLLVALNKLFEPLARVTGRPWLDFVPYALLALHVIACWVAYRALSGWRLLGAPVAWLTVLIAHLGLVSHASTPLTDTPATDCVLLAVAATATVAAKPPGEPVRLRRLSEWLTPCGLGVILSALVLLRPVAALGATVSVVLFGSFLIIRRRPVALAGLVLGLGLVMGPALGAAYDRFGTLTLMNPWSSAERTARIAPLGLDNVRTYFVGRGLGATFVADPILTEGVRAKCGRSNDYTFASTAAHVLRHPSALALLVMRKSIALCDQRHLTPYTVLHTPNHFASVGRALGALTWAGLVVLAVRLGAGLFLWVVTRAGRFVPFAACWTGAGARWKNPEVACDGDEAVRTLVVVSLPLVYFGTYFLTTVESRYGLCAAPFGLLALGAWLSKRGSRPGLPRRKRWILLALLVSVFYATVWSWDRLDVTQTRITASNPQLRIATRGDGQRRSPGTRFHRRGRRFPDKARRDHADASLSRGSFLPFPRCPRDTRQTHPVGFQPENTGQLIEWSRLVKERLVESCVGVEPPPIRRM